MDFSSAPALLLLLLPLVTQTPATATPVSPATTPDGMQSYHSDVLHLDYGYPQAYVDASSIVGPAFQASLSGNAAVAPTARCITVPFSRMASDKGQANIVILLRADAACLKKKFNAQSVADLAAGEAQGIAASGAKTSFGKPTSYEVDHRPASRLEGSFTLPTGQTMQSMVVCVLDQPDIACWQFLSSATAGLATMGAFPVTFAGSQPTSLVPAATPAAAK